MSTVVVIPTHNEVGTIEKTLEATLRLNAGVHVLVVDDDSTDGTRAVIERFASDPRVTALYRPAKLGLGSAYRDGFAWALSNGFDVVCEMDADLSHDPADVRRLVTELDSADLAVGSRYVPGGWIEGWPVTRKMLSRCGNLYVRMLTGCPIRDVTAGFRAYRRSLLEALDPSASVKSEGYSFQIEMTLRAWHEGFEIVEIPITFRDRTTDSSKMDRSIVLEALWRTAYMSMALRRERRNGVVAVKDHL